MFAPRQVKRKRTITVTSGTWTGDNSLSTANGEPFRLCTVLVHYDAGISNDATVSLDSKLGPNYDTVLLVADNSGGGVTDNTFEFGDEYVFEAGNEIIIAANVGTDNAYAQITTEEI